MDENSPCPDSPAQNKAQTHDIRVVVEAGVRLAAAVLRAPVSLDSQLFAGLARASARCASDGCPIDAVVHALHSGVCAEIAGGAAAPETMPAQGPGALAGTLEVLTAVVVSVYHGQRNSDPVVAGPRFVPRISVGRPRDARALRASRPGPVGGSPAG